MHPHTELRYVNQAIGYGVFATKFIPKGTITWVLDDLDQKLDESYILSLPLIFRDKLLKYCYRDRQGKYILCWDLGRYVNHSFHSNCLSTSYEFELAVRDIYPGEELTDDYGYLNLDEPFYCFHEKGTARTKVMPDDILHYYQEWDQKLAESMNYFNNVEQPLKNLINPIFANKITAIASHKEKMESILGCYYDRERKIKAVS